MTDGMLNKALSQWGRRSSVLIELRRPHEVLSCHDIWNDVKDAERSRKIFEQSGYSYRVDQIEEGLQRLCSHVGTARVVAVAFVELCQCQLRTPPGQNRRSPALHSLVPPVNGNV